jgi:hypothetical protein
MPTTTLDKIDIGGPCKLSDNGTIIYFEDGVKISPEPVWRAVASSVAGEQDDTLVDLVYKITGRPKSVWSAPYRASLLPDALLNFTASGGLVCGSANRSLIITSTNAKGFTFTRGALTKPPGLFLGVGGSLYEDVEYTAFLGQGKALTDADAFMAENTTAWSQSDYPTTNQEAVCTGAWGAVTGWDSVWAEAGFKLAHELKLNPVKSGNITVDYKVEGYRGMVSFDPQEPTTTQLLTALALQGAGGGIGVRRSANAADWVVSGAGISVTLKSAGLRKGVFNFDNKLNRHGEFAMVTALTTPGSRLVFA